MKGGRQLLLLLDASLGTRGDECAASPTGLGFGKRQRAGTAVEDNDMSCGAALCQTDLSQLPCGTAVMATGVLHTVSGYLNAGHQYVQGPSTTMPRSLAEVLPCTRTVTEAPLAETYSNPPVPGN